MSLENVSIPYEHFCEEDDCMRKPTCGTVRTCMYLTSDGYALPCIPCSHSDQHKEQFPNVEQVPLSKILSGSTYLDFMKHTLGDYLERNPKCQACAYKNRCAGGCRAKGFTSNENAETMAPDLEACRFFLDGYYERVKSFIEGLGASRSS